MCPQLSSASADRVDDSRGELLDRAHDLLPILGEHAEEAERLRHLPDVTAQVLRTEGMFRLGTPLGFGGHSAGVRTTMEVTAELARADASAAWVCVVYTGTSLIAGLMDLRAQQDIWERDPDAPVMGTLTPSGQARPLDGGLVVSGRWGFGSGVDHAQWAVLAVAPGPHNDAPQIVLVPCEELRIEDTWHVAGMSGTGSKTVVAEEVRVPAHRVLDMGEVLAGKRVSPHADERFRVSVSSQLALTVTAPMLGMARAALDLTLKTAQRKPVSLTSYARLADSPSVQLATADAASLIDTAELHAYRAADELDAAAAQDRRPTVPERARVRMDTAVVAMRTREAVDRLVSVNGAGAFAQSNPLQRIWRDLSVASRHGVVNPDLAREIHGRALLGIEDQPTAII